MEERKNRRRLRSPDFALCSLWMHSMRGSRVFLSTRQQMRHAQSVPSSLLLSYFLLLLHMRSHSRQTQGCNKLVIRNEGCCLLLLLHEPWSRCELPYSEAFMFSTMHPSVHLLYGFFTPMDMLAISSDESA